MALDPARADARTWLDEVAARAAATSHMVVVGGPNEEHLLRQGRAAGWHTTRAALTSRLAALGYDVVVAWDLVGGTRVLHANAPDLGPRMTPVRNHNDPGTELVSAMGLVHADDGELRRTRRALLVTGVERLGEGPDSDPVRRVLAVAQAYARPGGAEHPPQGPNSVFWLVDREHDLPHWYLGTQGVHVVSVPGPDRATRTAAALAILGDQFAADLSGRDEAQIHSAADRFATQSQGMSLAQMREVGRFAVDRRVGVDQLEVAVRGIQSGLTGSPWRADTIGEELRMAPALVMGHSVDETDAVVQRLRRRGVTPVLGQEPAVRKAFDVVIRSYLGLTDWDRATDTSRPRGVLFFAGPTGVGKTELSRQLATVVFERPEAMVRFDMSEYSSEHSEARLIGAPPGYVGHEGGGQLTGAVRQQPFSVLLFDEIDKANPRILDKFLQILDAGRLTDGSGATVHFSESIIVFTSNLGIFDTSPTDEPGAPARRLVRPGDSYEVVQQTVHSQVKKFFTQDLKRPELLNRIGDNIVIFNHLTPEVAARLAMTQIDALEQAVGARRGIRVTVGRQTREALAELVTREEHLENGGRGVNNAIQSALVNPMARALLTVPAGRSVTFDHGVNDALRMTIQ